MEAGFLIGVPEGAPLIRIASDARKITFAFEFSVLWFSPADSEWMEWNRVAVRYGAETRERDPLKKYAWRNSV